MTTDSRVIAARALLAIRAAEESFLGFVRWHHPNWDIPDFHLDLIDRLDRLEKNTLVNEQGQLVRSLAISMPPRHSKSTIATVLFPTYYLARRPTRFVISSSYNADLATDFGRLVRDMASSPRTRQVFPKIAVSRDSRAVDAWSTTAGGRYFSVGLGGTTSGRPANLLIVDDPIKDRVSAESIVTRDNAWNYYVSSLSTRLQPEEDGTPPAQLMIMTRYHPDDPIGRLEQTPDWKNGRWLYIRYPALTTDDNGNERALWPARYPVEWLRQRRSLDEREFASLYQQQPYIEGGNMIKRAWFRRYKAPADLRAFSAIIITLDPAYSKKNNADYSVALVAGLTPQGDIYIIDIVRGKFDFPELKQRLIHLNNYYRGRGLRAIYIEDRASGPPLIQELRRQSGLAVIPHKVVLDKISRTASTLPLIEGGRVFLPDSGWWVEEFLRECEQFPSATFDDQVDALVMALDILSRMAVPMDDGINIGDALIYRSADSYGKSLSAILRKTRGSWNGWGL